MIIFLLMLRFHFIKLAQLEQEAHYVHVLGSLSLDAGQLLLPA